MGIFTKIFKKELSASCHHHYNNDDIIAIADGIMIDAKEVSDPLFADEKLGETAVFRFAGDNVTICSPANGTLSVLFPTGHAFGITMNNNVELLVHIGVNTVDMQGDGFHIINKKQGDEVTAGEPIVSVDFNRLSKFYDTSTMLIITNDNGQNTHFTKLKSVKKGQKINI